MIRRKSTSPVPPMRRAGLGLAVLVAGAFNVASAQTGAAWLDESYGDDSYDGRYDMCARVVSAANRRDNMPGSVRGILRLRNQQLWPHERQNLDRANESLSPDTPPGCREVVLATELDITQFTNMAGHACAGVSERRLAIVEEALLSRAAAWRQRVESACR